LDAPQQVLAHQQAPEDVDMLPVAGHGAGLRPGLLNSVEPIGIVGTPSCEVAGVEVLDCEDVALPAPAAGTHVVVIGAAAPGNVAPVMIPTPLLSNSAVELDAPVIALPGLEHAVAEATPLEVPELTPGVASGAAPKGIPVGATAVPEVLMPKGEVVGTAGVGVPIPRPWA
jgi:hypothetical protein